LRSLLRLGGMENGKSKEESECAQQFVKAES
jgi:hypothetical protein